MQFNGKNKISRQTDIKIWKLAKSLIKCIQIDAILAVTLRNSRRNWRPNANRKRWISRWVPASTAVCAIASSSSNRRRSQWAASTSWTTRPGQLIMNRARAPRDIKSTMCERWARIRCSKDRLRERQLRSWSGPSPRKSTGATVWSRYRAKGTEVQKPRGPLWSLEAIPAASVNTWTSWSPN